MTELEKATLAVMIAGELLRIEKKILAIKLIRYMYSAGLSSAKSFVDKIENMKPKLEG